MRAIGVCCRNKDDLYNIHARYNICKYERETTEKHGETIVAAVNLIVGQHVQPFNKEQDNF
jgi:hypothetical protein